MKLIIRLLLILSGVLLISDTIATNMLSNGNLGTYLPAVLGLPLFIIGIFFTPISAWFASGFGAFIKWALIVGYTLFVLLIAVMGSIIHVAGTQPMQQADALIVLGCGVRGERVSLTLKYRLERALEYMQRYPDALIVVSGGQGEGEDISEAEAMKRYLVARGALEARILMEDSSTSTYENFMFSKRIISERLGEGASIAFVTTRFHVFRAQRVAAKLGIDAYGIGAKGVWYITPNDYLRECIAVTVYAIMGRI